MGLPYKKGVFLPRWKMAKAKGHPAFPVPADVFAWGSCHRAVVAVAPPRSHMGTSLAALGQGQLPAQGAQGSGGDQPCAIASSSAHTAHSCSFGPESWGKWASPRHHNNDSGRVCPGKAWRKEERGAGEGITKRLPLWRKRLEMISHCSCFDSPNALARTISQSR